ncbi:MAG: RibD family protein [Bacteroidota bacterium]
MWNVILSIRDALKDKNELPRVINLSKNGKDIVTLHEDNTAGASLTIRVNQMLLESYDPFITEPFSFEIHEDVFPQQELNILKMYLPYAFLDWCGSKLGKCFAISHFAQTLDGRIASCSGDSKWIGNEENLIHAHRMRALCKAILVGSKTIEHDDPRLNVRMVLGSDPVKVIIGGNGQFYKNQYKAINRSTLVFQDSNDNSPPFERVMILKSPNYDPHQVLGELAKRKIHSVYIEGGSFTTSSFLKAKALDQVQLHFSARIIGSGHTSFSFEGIKKINDAITFSHGKFIPVGDEVMFIGKPNP